MIRDTQGDSEVRIETPVPLDASFDGRPFSVHQLALRGLAENSIFEVHLLGSRIGFMIPANSLGSVDHDYGEKQFFHQCAYVIIKSALTELIERSSKLLEPNQSAPSIQFSDLFDDNVCFLLLSSADLMHVPDFNLDRILPSLIAYGFVPAASCNPADLGWRSALPQAQKRLHVSLVAADVDNHEIVARLCVLAAVSAPSKVMQFFYFYQVIEHLLESVSRHRLRLVARDLIASLENGSGDLHDEFLTLQEQMREKVRLKLLVSQYSDCPRSLDDLGLASGEFLRSMGLKESFGIDAVYSVRNFLFHQARKLPEQGDKLLEEVVEAFAQFVPALLQAYRFPASPMPV